MTATVLPLRRRAPWRRVFLNALRSGASPAVAAQVAGVSVGEAVELRRGDAAFALEALAAQVAGQDDQDRAQLVVDVVIVLGLTDEERDRVATALVRVGAA